uniref:Uncharacterized protein n=1 Tax=Coccolithus braarudii TaxID=221442 RepID=A0A7S0L587_9EUKA|mmetsp:Transcript_18333/g.39439  ORF Transcript_18333/g.39439 Transcript_18333/m.39439 type:complete len:158 (+) Transcript_18333:676-1149(+)
MSAIPSTKLGMADNASLSMLEHSLLALSARATLSRPGSRVKASLSNKLEHLAAPLHAHANMLSLNEERSMLELLATLSAEVATRTATDDEHSRAQALARALGDALSLSIKAMLNEATEREGVNASAAVRRLTIAACQFASQSVRHSRSQSARRLIFG